MNDPCIVCTEVSTNTTPFCDSHEAGWVQSEERKLVDFHSEDSYKWAISAYVERLNAPTNNQTSESE